MEKNDFKQALATLNLKWADDMRAGELFDAIDLAAHGSRYQKMVRI